MFRVRFRIRTIMIVIAVCAVFMVALRIMSVVDTARLSEAVNLALALCSALVMFFAPFIAVAIALWAVTFSSIRKSAARCIRHPDQSLRPAQSGEAERVKVKDGTENHQRV